MTEAEQLAQLMAEDAEAMAAAIPNDDAIRNIAHLCEKQKRLERRVVRTKLLLEHRESQLARVQELELPDAMAAAGTAGFTLPDGSRLTVGDDYHVNIPSANSDSAESMKRRSEAFGWLRDHGHEDLIKQEVRVVCTKGEQDKARRVMAGLDKAGIDYSNTESVHPSTLKAFVREQIENGTEGFPRAAFGVHHRRIAKVLPAKQQRKTNKG